MCRLLAMTFLLVLAAAACAQLDRRSRDEPEMFVEAGGRSGTCDVMMFSPDGKFLYAGGDDKVVRVWPVGPNGLETGRMRTLRWPAWREQRGGVKTIALPPNPTDRRVLVGGFGLKNGLVVLLDPDGEILATNDIDGEKLPTATVMASTFAPDGKSVVYGTADGRLWWWDLGKNNHVIGQFAPIERKPYNRPRLIRFINDSNFISVAQNGEVLSALLRNGECALQPQTSINEQLRSALTADGKAPPTGDLNVYRADLSADGKWLACAMSSKYVVLAPLSAGPGKIIRTEFFARSVAFDRTGRLAVGSAGVNKQTDYRLDSYDLVQVFDDPTKGRPVSSIEIKHPGRAEALAWTPDGLLAIAGGDNHEVTLHNLKPPVKEAAGPLQVVRGKGRGIWDVRVGKDGESILFRTQRNPAATDPNDRGIGPWQAFDFASGKPCEPKTAVPVRTTADGWKIEPSDKNPFVWYAVHESGKRHELTLDPDRDEQPRCYCFLPAKGKKPIRLLVGHYYGFSIFELTPERAVRSLLATGQAGDVHSIATDADGAWCVTGGADQTIAGWSLADWPSGPFGAALEIKEGRLFVTAVDLGGPAWEMGLSKGDEIVLAVRGGKEILYGRAGRYQATTLTADTGNAAAAMKALLEPIPGREYYLGWKRAGSVEVLEGLSTLRRRPLWRMFPGFESNERFEHWVAWMWKGGHYATSTSGDFLVGWQLNDPDTITQRRPEFFLANRFKGVLNKKLAVLRLMQTRDLVGALTELAGDNPQPPQFGKMEPAPVRLDLKGDAVDKNGLHVDIRVAARGKNPDLLPERVEIWVNDHRVKQWKPGGKTVAASETIPANAFRRGENEVTVITFNPAGGRGEARRMVKYDRDERRPRLLGLMVGINDYSQTAKNSDGTRDFGNLTSAGKDAKTLGDVWKSQVGKGKLYAEDKLIVTLDPKAHQKEILAALDELAKEATPDDLIVIFLAGHGDFVAKPDAKGADDKVFVFCCPDYNRKDWGKTGLSGEVLFDRLANCKARKLVLIDACHSGAAASENVVRYLLPDGQGPIVIAACDQKELSFEHPKFGHGLFTTAVLEALGDKLDTADRSRDGKLDPQELFDYIRGRMPALLKEAGKPERIQNPQAFPPELGRFPIAGKR
jgi:WD40 repeat protein